MEQQIARAERQASILKTLKVYEFSFSESNMASSGMNRNLVSEFLTTMEEDIEATKRELLEDNRERREDGRERRDDRTERKEKDGVKKRRSRGN